MAEGGQYRAGPGGGFDQGLPLSGIPGCPENPMESPPVLGGAAICLVCSAIFAAFSLGAVPPLAYGIRYNLFNKAADIENVYGPGRHFIGPWNTFLLFPANVQTIEFTSEPRLHASGQRYPALHSRTKEGLALHLQVSLQYQLKYDQVGSLYREFNKNYEQMFTSTIRDTLIRAASDYEAYQLWEERAAVGEKMQNMVDTALKRTYADCWGLQLMVIELPDLFEKSIVKTQVNKQNIATRQFEQETTKVKAQTSVIMAEFDKKVTVITSQGKANYTYAVKEAKALAKKKTIDTEAHIMNHIRDKLGLAAADMVEYQRFTAVQALENASVFYGFDENTQVMMTSIHRPKSVASSDYQGPDADSPVSLPGSATTPRPEL